MDSKKFKAAIELDPTWACELRECVEITNSFWGYKCLETAKTPKGFRQASVQREYNQGLGFERGV